MKLLTDSATNATTIKVRDYPLGTHAWRLFSPEYPRGIVTKLNLNPCHDNAQFTCDDGACVDVRHRCDDKFDCVDASDEVNCSKVTVGETYRNEVPAPALNGDYDAALRIVLDVRVISLLSFDESASATAIQFQIYLTWRDTRLMFNNLKNETHLNFLDSEDAKKIWYPKLIFYNTDTRQATKVTRFKITTKHVSKHVHFPLSMTRQPA